MSKKGPRKRLGTNRASIKNALARKKEGERVFGLYQKRFDEMEIKNECINSEKGQDRSKQKR